MPEAKPACRWPLVVEVEAGRRYSGCACGRSASQPFCDGSHRGTGLEPLAFIAQRSEWLWFCGCKRSAQAPLCDGTHKALP